MAAICHSSSAKSLPWCSDLSALDPTERRIGRYVWQMLSGSAWLQKRLRDREFLELVWQLSRPLLSAAFHQQLRELWAAPDPQDSGEFDLDIDALLASVPPGARALPDWDEASVRAPTGRSRRRRSHPDPRADASLRAFLDCFMACAHPKSLAHLAAIDGDQPSEPVIQWLVQGAGLDVAEASLLDFVAKRFLRARFTEFLREARCDDLKLQFELLGFAMGQAPLALQSRLKPGASLAMLQLLRRNGRHQPDLEDVLFMDNLLEKLLLTQPRNPDELLQAVVQPAPPAECSLAQFAHHQASIDVLLPALQAAMQGRVEGFNVLLHGVPGSGKTQFVLALAQQAGVQVYMVKTDDDEGLGLNRSGRLGAYLLTQRLLQGRTDCLVLFDEVEDAFGQAEWGLLAMLRGRPAPAKDKGWMNRLLESNPLPAFWLTNDTAAIDSAFLRRFLLSVAFDRPPRRVRRTIAEAHLGGYAVSAALLDELADDAALVPGQFQSARRLLDLLPPAEADARVRYSVQASRRLLCGMARPPRRAQVLPFRFDYLNLGQDRDPSAFIQGLRKLGSGTVLCHGAPGTGKSGFAQAVADALGRELITVRSSDLVSAFVGETERQIAQMFQALDAQREVLLLDEVDSLLGSREQAHYRWEVTQVNELLQHLEHCAGLVIATTNRLHQLDHAALRRFDVKLEFLPLRAEQRLALVAQVLGHESGPACTLSVLAQQALQGLDGLTAGDVAVVARQRLAGTLDAGENALVRALIAEVRLRQA